ncbi:hypothetical protein BCR35DRAFT_301447 [Leucosporidium creatinivorum]|uniref:F-box domain-containing protein n=1 Tax=Leucosporidium creatinivorum TaxID=106004 RepID=A0A1Y2FX81_9BASI|nr:hypothetical protein BCR35DRAFT_301447 [Leucosporidium creatinivorum]
MEASSPRSPTSLTSLPPELLADIAVHLPLGSLARFSLVSRSFKSVLQSKLYQKVDLSCDAPEELLKARRRALQTSLKLLADDRERSAMVRELDLRHWG